MDSNLVIPEIKIEEYGAEDKEPEDKSSEPLVTEEPLSETTIENTVVLPEASPEAETVGTDTTEDIAAPEEEKMEVDPPMENNPTTEPTPIDQKLEAMEVDEVDADSGNNEAGTGEMVVPETTQSTGESHINETLNPSKTEKEVISESTLMENVTSSQIVQEEMPEADPATSQDAERMLTQKALLQEPAEEEPIVHKSLPEELSTSETSISEEPMNQVPEIAQTDTGKNSESQPIISSIQASDLPSSEANEMQEVSKAISEEAPADEISETPAAEAPEGKTPEEEAIHGSDEPMATPKKEEPTQTPQLPSVEVPPTEIREVTPEKVSEPDKPNFDTCTVEDEPPKLEKQEPIASTSDAFNVNSEYFDLPKSATPKPIQENRPWIRPGSTVDITDYKNPEDSICSPAEKALKPWLGNDVPLYPLDLLPPVDQIPGRVWYPPRRYCNSTQYNVVGIGPLTELETLDLSLTPESMFLVEPEKYDLIIMRICEIQMLKLRRKLQEPRLSHAMRVEFHRQLNGFEGNYQEVAERAEKFRFRLALLPEIRNFMVPKRSYVRTYTAFDHTWYTTNRRWFEKSQQNAAPLSKRELRDQLRSVDKNFSKFENQLLENAAKHGEQSAEEKIRNFRLPLLYSLRQSQPQVKQRMIIFRRKLALYFQYEDFERCYLTDPGCREILKKLRPMPFNNGIVVREAEDELAALIVSYKHRFAREHPVKQLYKAGNERAPIAEDFEKHAKQCLEDMIDTVVFRELTDLPTFPHRVPANNNAIPKNPVQRNTPIHEGFPLNYYGSY